MLCVRWYLSFKLSARDLVQMMSERSIALAHTTILRWVQRYIPEFEKRWNLYARPVGGSWRCDETNRGLGSKEHGSKDQPLRITIPIATWVKLGVMGEYGTPNIDIAEATIGEPSLWNKSNAERRAA